MKTYKKLLITALMVSVSPLCADYNPAKGIGEGVVDVLAAPADILSGGAVAEKRFNDRHRNQSKDRDNNNRDHHKVKRCKTEKCQDNNTTERSKEKSQKTKRDKRSDF